MPITFFHDAAEFLTAAAPLLASDPLRCSVVASTAERRRGEELEDWAWFAIIEADSERSVAMRTHPEEPHAGFTTAMSEAAVAELIGALEARGGSLPACNGYLPAAEALCRAGSATGQARVDMHTRLFSLEEVTWPVRPAGSIRVADTGDLDIMVAWAFEFLADAEREGGRDVPAWMIDPPAETLARFTRNVQRRIDNGLLWLWENEGAIVHMTGATPAAFGVQRIGPVYTPAEHRGHGYAGFAVASVSQQILAGGVIPCLYTDQANPVSNKVYERIGYRAVADEGTVVAV